MYRGHHGAYLEDQTWWYHLWSHPYWWISVSDNEFVVGTLHRLIRLHRLCLRWYRCWQIVCCCKQIFMSTSLAILLSRWTIPMHRNYSLNCHWHINNIVYIHMVLPCKRAWSAGHKTCNFVISTQIYCYPHCIGSDIIIWILGTRETTSLLSPLMLVSHLSCSKTTLIGFEPMTIHMQSNHNTTWPPRRHCTQVDSILVSIYFAWKFIQNDHTK